MIFLVKKGTCVEAQVQHLNPALHTDVQESFERFRTHLELFKDGDFIV